MLGLLFVVAISLQLMWEWLGGCGPVSHASSVAPPNTPLALGGLAQVGTTVLTGATVIDSSTKTRWASGPRASGHCLF